MAKTPGYLLHRASGKARVRVNGEYRYLPGPYDSAESRAAYHKVVAALAEGVTPERPGATGPGAAFSVTELCVAFMEWADGYYRKNGEPTGQAQNCRYAIKTFRRLFGSELVASLRPLAVKKLQAEMIKEGLCRKEVNRRVRIVIQMVKWGVSEEYIPGAVLAPLAAVPSLKKDRTEAKEYEPVGPVPDEVIAATLPHLSPVLRAMVEVARYTGMRPSEVCDLRACDIDRTGDPWVYRPGSHKTEHHGRAREVQIGPKARAALSPFLTDREPTAYLFSPTESVAWYRARKRSGRKSPMTPSQAARQPKENPAKAAGSKFTADSFTKAIKAQCHKAGVEPWHANRLRHSAATEIRAKFGLEAAQVALGHARADVVQVYAERDRSKAARVASEIG
jgi:integrase